MDDDRSVRLGFDPLYFLNGIKKLIAQFVDQHHGMIAPVGKENGAR